MTMWSQRARVVRPPKGDNLDNLLPIEEEESGDLEAKKYEAEGGGTEERKQEEGAPTEAKVEDLQRRLAEYFEDSNGLQAKDPPRFKAPDQPTKEQWERHQIIHIPCATWCKHSLAARAIRHQHPSR